MNEALAATFGATFITSLSGALSPGPLSTLAVKEGVVRGPWAGFLLALGHSGLELPVVVVLALGLEELLNSQAVEMALALLGGLVLLWFGWGAITAARRPPLTETWGAGEARSLLAAGVIVSVSNPFWVAWWGTVGARLVADGLQMGTVGVATVYVAHIATDLGWLSLMAAVAAKGRRVMGGLFHRCLLGVSSLGLWALAGWFLYRLAIALM